MRAERLKELGRPAAAGRLWRLDRGVDFLNHGSFGACLREVLAYQRGVRERMERQPVQFFVRDLEELLDEARGVLARFVGVKSRDLVFVPNATHGVNTVLRSLRFRRGDELLVTDHEYNACRNALDFVAGAVGVRVVVARVPFPLRSEEEAFEAIAGRLTRRTRLVLLDHVTSPTGMVMPLERWVPWLAGRGVEVLVDGAHAPGMVPLRLERLGATYYTANCHKWIGAPKGAAFLWVREDRQDGVRPLAISHGANSLRRDRSRYQVEFGWTGTMDPSAWLSVPVALGAMAGLVEGGWVAIRRRNRLLALEGRRLLCEALGVEEPCPASMIGSMASVPLPCAVGGVPPVSPLYLDPLQDRLLGEEGIEVPIVPWPAYPRRLVRVSAQLYNHLGQYERLAGVLKRVLQMD
ncbi:MAG: hypothetical protein RI897_763 [Verrucomicrobiota bacterium]